MTTERVDCPRCEGRGELLQGGDLVTCDGPGCIYGVLNAAELGWIDAGRERLAELLLAGMKAWDDPTLDTDWDTSEFLADWLVRNGVSAPDITEAP